MDRLLRLYHEFGQSPWLDNLKRGYITSGELANLAAHGVRGLTSNPTIFQKAIQGSADYDEQFRSLAADDRPVIEDYWSMVLQDIHSALDVFAPVYHQSYGGDGYVSVEVDPGLAHDAAGTESAARHLHTSIARPNLMVKIPATVEGLPAIQQMIAEGRSINVTLIFSLERYQAVMEAYLAGLEQYAATPGADLSKVASVASFFISRVDTEIDQRLDAIGSPEALALRGQGAVAQGKLAYQLFQRTFSGPRWEALRARGAVVQRPLWASTSTKNPAYPDTRYVDELIGPDTVNTLPDATLEAFADHGTLERRVDADVDQAEAAWAGLSAVGVDLDDVAAKLEREGVSSFQKSFDELLGALTTKAAELREKR
ncbi:MAG: transaldolase [Acidimicrobiales bacterium]|nr:transaldolase [Acidimicrobiales bacterium]MCB9394532.1 transaldolase [Acidimicrobiaceae bacterium]